MCSRRLALSVSSALVTLLLPGPGCGDDEARAPADDAATADSAAPDTAPADTAAPDTSTVDTATPDTAPADSAAPADAVEGGFGAPCTGNADCLSGWCVEGPEGYLCTRTCDLECPSGYSCRAVSSRTDPSFICVPELRRPCAPCTTDAQCPQGGRCLAQDGGRGCAHACDDLADCPPDFLCAADPTGAAPGRWCQPATGSCTCRPGVDGGQRVCAVENALGACSGVETCAPATGWGPCSAATPAAEVCDLADNDCDGAIDEDFRGPDGAFTQDAHCGTCQRACADLFAHGDGHCAADGPAPICVVSACDDGWVQLNDFQCVEPPDVSCQPCTTDATCFDGTCAPLDGQQVCLMPCDGPAKLCPEGFACGPVAGAERCLPLTGSCACNAVTAGQARPCAVANDHGLCAGASVCDATLGWSACNAPEPAAERCNGLDDDCDGQTDTGLAPEPCKLDLGVCAGATKRCAGGLGWLPCGAESYGSDYELTEVSCDGLDNDCDGHADDVDRDGDGVAPLACGGLDCDDAHPLTYPGAAEIYDTRDSDCDGVVDEGQVPAGALIVSEIMLAPTPPATAWVELHNAWSFPVNVATWTLTDGGGHALTLSAAAGVVLQPGESAVACADADPLTNGGLSCDFAWGDALTLDGSLRLSLAGQLVDAVAYGAFTAAPGRSLSLDPNTHDAAHNDLPGNWCPAPLLGTALPGGDHGTPGTLNPACSGAPTVSAVVPDNGVDNGGELVTVRGSGFTGATDVRLANVPCAAWQVLDDTTLRCTTPAGTAGRVPVRVIKGSQAGERADAYRYTGEAVTVITWCDLQFPATLPHATAGVSVGDVYGQVRAQGVTEAAGAPPGLQAELGWGPLGVDPRNAPGWSWSTATAWNRQYFANDEFRGSFAVPTAGAYAYGWRFSDDGGLNYLYCDFDPGTANTFSVGDLGVVTVQ